VEDEGERVGDLRNLEEVEDLVGKEKVGSAEDEVALVVVNEENLAGVETVEKEVLAVGFKNEK
jgi:hypothetical protein